MDIKEFNTETKELMKKANKVYLDNFLPVAWFGRCIFLSWYCDVGTCKFCFRSTIKDRIKHAKHARRSISSILVEPLLAKHLGWRIEFLTGGYKIFPVEELVKIAGLVEKVYGEKIWLNLGALKKEELEQFSSHVKGVVASIETVNKELHDSICPNKPIEPYNEMLSAAKEIGMKRSMTIVIGLGEKKEHFAELKNFISKHSLERITFYALKPVKGTPYTHGPTTEEYVWWIAQTRIAFPKIEIIAGTTARRVGEVEFILRAGANAITKFPATKKFGSDEAKILEEGVKQAGREWKSTLTKLPDVNWAAEIEKLDIDSELKKEVLEKVEMYLKRMR